MMNERMKKKSNKQKVIIIFFLFVLFFYKNKKNIFIIINHMSTKSITVFQFKEYNSTINRYSKGNQKMEKKYKGILESETGEAIYDQENPSYGAHGTLKIQPNLPVYNKVIGDVKIEDQNVPVYKTFWQYKQPAGTIFTDWTSAGLSHIREDMSIRDLALYGKIQDPTLVLSNTNNIRNNFQRYGKEYLTSTNMLNAEAFSNGATYQQAGKSTYRNSTKDIQNTILHGSFGNKEHGDQAVRNENVLRVDLPENFANTTVSSWQKANPAFSLLNPDKTMALVDRVQLSTLNLDAMKLTGLSCLTEEFGVIPTDYNYPTDVLSNTDEFPPVPNPNYYNNHSQDYHKQQGKGEGLYCSANTNYVTMPRNHLYRDLDTSFSVGLGNNSVTLGSVMSPKLIDFIQSTLYEYNRDFVFMSIFNYLSVELQNKIKHISPYLFDKSGKLNTDYNNIHDEGEKYKYIYNIQRNLLTLEQGHPELEVFIANLSIIKIGGNNIKHPHLSGYVLCSELHETAIPIKGKGAFVLLPTMLAPDLFTVQKSGHPDCFDPATTYQQNATNCGFRGKANTWQQKEDPTFVPNMFDDPENPNNFIYNLNNPYLGKNPDNAPSTF